MQEICRMVGTVLTEWQTVVKKLPAFKAHAAAVQTSRRNSKRLLGKTFRRRYAVRAPAALSALPEGHRHASRQAQGQSGARRAADGRVRPLWTNYERRAIQLGQAWASVDPQVEQFRWLLEELRVNCTRRNCARRCRCRPNGCKSNGKESRMGEVMQALARTFANLKSGKVWLYVLTPALFALLLSIGLAVWALGAVVQHLLNYPPMTWLAAWGLPGWPPSWPTSAAGWRSSPLPTCAPRCSRPSSSCR
jgi:hypothetical protein